MSQTLETMRRARLHDAQQTLEGLSTRITDLERAHAAAVEAFEAARAVMDDLVTEIDEVRSRHRHVASSVEDLLVSMRRDVVKRLPADVLVQIFETATLASSTIMRDGFGESRTDFGDATEVAFVLSAVCAQWRRTALNHGPLWSCIELDFTEGIAAQPVHLERVQLLLTRSRASYINILLDWSTYSEWHACEISRAVLDELCLQASRWRTLEFHVPDAQHLHDGLRVLKGPLPLLRHLRITAQDLETQPSITECDYLPFAPNLSTLVIYGPHGLMPLSHGRWGALRTLRIVFPLSFELLWGLLEAAAATLETLVLLVSMEAPANVPVLVLPQLTALKLAVSPEFDSFVDALRLPRLEHFGSYGQMLGGSPSWSPFLERVAPTVTRISLSGDIGPHILRLTKCLNRVRHLSIDKAKCASQAAFFEDKRLWVDEAAWPALSCVKLAAGQEARDPSQESCMLPFVRWRTEQLREQYPEDSRPTRLKEFILDDPDAPQWLRWEIDRLIGAASVAKSAL